MRPTSLHGSSARSVGFVAVGRRAVSMEMRSVVGADAGAEAAAPGRPRRGVPRWSGGHQRVGAAMVIPGAPVTLTGLGNVAADIGPEVETLAHRIRPDLGAGARLRDPDEELALAFQAASPRPHDTSSPSKPPPPHRLRTNGPGGRSSGARPPSLSHSGPFGPRATNVPCFWRARGLLIPLSP